MKWEYVSSSNLSAVAYDESTEELYIQFNSGHTYYYPNIPKYLFDGLMSANSKGSYHAEHIKDLYCRRIN